MLRRKRIAVLLILAAAGWCAWSWARNREPVYLGHPVTYWTEPWHHHGTETSEREAAAFAAMDERAVRWLARQLDWRPSRTKESFGKLMNSFFGDFMSDRDYDGGRRASSIRALRRLGPRARNAVPALEKASRTTVEQNQVPIRGEALGALIAIRGDDLGPYVEKLKAAQGDEWTILTFALAGQGTNAAAAAPVIAGGVQRGWIYPALYALGEIRSHPESSVPALIQSLSITSRIERDAAFGALRKFGPEAAPAWPQLFTIMTNGDRYTSQDVARVLRAIDPARAAGL